MLDTNDLDLDDLLAQVKAQSAADSDRVLACAARVKTAADHLAQLLQRQQRARIAQVLTGTTAAGLDVAPAVAELWAALRAWPEAAERLAPEVPVSATPGAPAPAVSDKAPVVSAGTASPEALRLASQFWQERVELLTAFRQVDFAAPMSEPLFVACAQEFAAWARGLMERGDTDRQTEWVIRKLGYHAHERGIRQGIIGLARDAQGDWKELMAQARAAQQRLRERATPPAPPKAVPPPIALAKPVAAAPAPPVEEPEAEAETLELPALTAAVEARRLVVCGGDAVPRGKVEWLQSVVGPNVEWVLASDLGRLRTQVAHGTVGALIVCMGLVSTPDALLDMARRANVPVGRASTAGKGQLRTALFELESRLSPKESAAPVAVGRR